MPTIILLDASLSMTKPVQISDNNEMTRKQLAILGINAFLDHLSIHTKLEFILLVAFSSLYDENRQFTRDYNLIKTELQNVDDYDKTCIETALHGVNQLVLSEWGNNTSCQVFLVTDGSSGIGAGSLKESLATIMQRTPTNPFPLPFAFPAKLHVLAMCPPTDPNFIKSKPLYQRLVDLTGYEGSISVPDVLNEAKVVSIFQKLAEDVYTSFKGIIKFGNLESKIILSPAPLHHTKVADFDSHTFVVSDVIEVCGFVAFNDISSPMVISKHLILPASSSNKDPMAMETEIDLTTDEVLDEGKMPSFAVLLHGALKTENVAALVTLGENWFGFVYSWEHHKKKANLMMTILAPGSDVIPWLGDLNYLGTPDLLGPEQGTPSVRPTEKRSYSQNGVVWIRSAGLQSDIQKILRHARKLPEKTPQFYKELNRLRKAAISLGFLELLVALATIFEQECLQLPGNAHPDCAVQLQHAAEVLKKTQTRDAKYVITPYSANYSNL